jgi:peptidyl-prolyl cis-trans isomerase C
MKVNASHLKAVFVLGVVCFSTGCPKPPQTGMDANTLVSINNDVISKKEFEQRLFRETRAMEGTGPLTPAELAPFKQSLLDTMIEARVVLEAARTLSISVTPDELDRKLLALSGEYPAGTFEQMLTASKTTPDELRRDVKERLVIEKFFTETVFSRLAATEGQVRQYYDEHADEFQEPEKVHGAQIVVVGLDDIKRLQQQLWQGKKFTELAQKFSISPDAKVGGDLGFVARGELPKQFEDVLFKLGVNQTSEVVASEYGFHLFRVLEKQPARKRELAQVRALIESKLLAQLRASAQAQRVAELKSKAAITVNQEAFQQAVGHQ